MCIACELGFWDMIDALEPEVRERILREQAERFTCDTPASEPQTQSPPIPDERKS